MSDKPHYSTVLKGQIKEREGRLEEIDESILELMSYMNSEKYHCASELDGYISISDVQTRLEEMRILTILGGE